MNGTGFSFFENDVFVFFKYVHLEHVLDFVCRAFICFYKVSFGFPGDLFKNPCLFIERLWVCFWFR